jgi:hypothetical protein
MSKACPCPAEWADTCDELVVDKIGGRAILPSSLSPTTDRDRGGPQWPIVPPDNLVGRRVNILASACASPTGGLGIGPGACASLATLAHPHRLLERGGSPAEMASARGRGRAAAYGQCHRSCGAGGVIVYITST